MKANELRIGNYFQWDEFASMGHGIDTIKHGQQLMDYVGFKNPIPLTEECLLRMGFRKRDNFGITWFVESLNISQDKSNNFYFGSTLKIQYVHQLQNLYHALTGEELKINDR